MKQFLVNILTIAFFACLLLFPFHVFNGAQNGLLLWFNTVLPTLLPFIIASNLLLHTSALNWITTLFYPFLGRIFHTSKHGTFVVISGFLCGYPMGGKTSADLLRKNKISYQEASYLLSFCNNTSPMFIISFILMQNLKNNYPVVPMLIIFMLSPILCSYIFYYFYYRKRINSAQLLHSISNDSKTDNSYENLIDLCIMNGFETITRIGGYIILFTILIELASYLPFDTYIFDYILFPSLEITKGITDIGSSVLTIQEKFVLCLSHASFGGWCSLAQTYCMIKDTSLKVVPYTIEKLITALVTSLLCISYILLFH